MLPCDKQALFFIILTANALQIQKGLKYIVIKYKLLQTFLLQEVTNF